MTRNRIRMDRIDKYVGSTFVQPLDALILQGTLAVGAVRILDHEMNRCLQFWPVNRNWFPASAMIAHSTTASGAESIEPRRQIVTR